MMNNVYERIMLGTATPAELREFSVRDVLRAYDAELERLAKEHALRVELAYAQMKRKLMVIGLSESEIAELLEEPHREQT